MKRYPKREELYHYDHLGKLRFTTISQMEKAGLDIEISLAVQAILRARRKAAEEALLVHVGITKE